jgi:hypothetical protein
MNYYRCLVHVINLATQAVIKSFSSAKYYNPYNPDDHLPINRDELGIIRSIAVKVSIQHISCSRMVLNLLQVKSSSKRKELFLKIQRDRGSSTPRVIPLDMVVHWSSTHRLVDSGIMLKDVCYFYSTCITLSIDTFRCSISSTSYLNSPHRRRMVVSARSWRH